MALAVDGSSPARATGALTDGTLTISTATFNPPAAVLVATVQANARATGTTFAITNNGIALPWALVSQRSADVGGGLRGYAGIFVAVLPVARTGMTVTATATPSGASTTGNSPSLKVYVVTGADTTQPVGG